MIDLLLAGLVYALFLGLFLKIRFPKTTFECSKCNKVSNAYHGKSCKCGKSFSIIDEDNEIKRKVRLLEKFGLVKRLK